MTDTPEIDPEWTEGYDAEIPRVDLVGKAANGVPGFLLMKQDGAGLLDPDTVRDLIAKATPALTEKDEITMTGSPAAIAAMIAAAPVRKADEAEPVVKADDLDPTVVLAEPTEEMPGDPADPGSPAWEAIDAATACKWTAILSRAKVAICTLAEREMIEATTGDGGDSENAWNLEDATCAIDYAISVLAPFAVGEMSEAEQGAESLSDLAKALGGFDVAPLDLVEGLTPVVKAGRVLSTSNEAAIRGAVESLQKVLASLPAPTDDGQPVAKEKETEMTDTQREADALAILKAALEEGEAVEAADRRQAAIDMLLKAKTEDGWRVEKAKGDPQVAVYDADGSLVGTIDPADLSPIASPTPPDGGDSQGGDEPAAAADPNAVAAAAEDSAVIPGTDTVAAPPPADDEMTKAAQAGAAAALAEFLPTLTAKLGASAEAVELVKALQERVDELAKQPDDRKSPRLNGGTGVAGLAGLTEGDQLAAVKKAIEDEPDPVKKQTLERALTFAEIKARF